MSTPAKPKTYGTPPKPQDPQARSVGRAIWDGARKKCPECHQGPLFSRFTNVNDHCPQCGLYLGGHRADDAPPYFTMLIAGHLTVPLLIEMQWQLDPPLWFVLGFWSLVICLEIWALLPITKGALIGVQWANRMHGFSDNPDEDLEASLK